MQIRTSFAYLSDLSDQKIKPLHLLGVFWKLSKPYWTSKEKWPAIGLLTSIVALALGAVYLIVWLNTWYKNFYDSLEQLNATAFWSLIGQFGIVAAIWVIVNVYKNYLTQLLSIRWRRSMTHQLVDRYLADRTYYLWQLVEKTGDNPDQRIQEDIARFIDEALNLALDLLQQVVTLASFIGILWAISGTLVIPLPGGGSFSLAHDMVWIALIYSILGTWIAHLLGRSLVKLRFEQQKAEANFRFSLVRVRENGESIALSRGEPAENAQLGLRFSELIQNFRAIMIRTKKLGFFTFAHGQASVIVPFVVSAGRFFAQEITLGGLMQINSAFGRVQEALSFFVGAYARVADWLSTIVRLEGFVTSLEHAQSAGNPSRILQTAGSTLATENLVLCLPAGEKLSQPLNLELKPGESWVIRGPSGCGKSTLLRSVAGIWPFYEGTIRLPGNMRGMVVPQKPYLPVDSLRAALTYPLPPADFSDAVIASALRDCNLASLEGRLDEVASWQQMLSPGEQQRVAFVRVLLQKPDWLFLDEATSALDEATQQQVYAIIKQRLTGLTLVSIAHRESVLQHHDYLIEFPGSGSGSGAVVVPLN